LLAVRAAKSESKSGTNLRKDRGSTPHPFRREPFFLLASFPVEPHT
jgi:hypothetical protein